MDEAQRWSVKREVAVLKLIEHWRSKGFTEVYARKIDSGELVKLKIEVKIIKFFYVAR